MKPGAGYLYGQLGQHRTEYSMHRSKWGKSERRTLGDIASDRPRGLVCDGKAVPEKLEFLLNHCKVRDFEREGGECEERRGELWRQILGRKGKEGGVEQRAKSKEDKTYKKRTERSYIHPKPFQNTRGVTRNDQQGAARNACYVGRWSFELRRWSMWCGRCASLRP